MVKKDILNKVNDLIEKKALITKKLSSNLARVFLKNKMKDKNS
jgi:hypothetical protein